MKLKFKYINFFYIKGEKKIFSPLAPFKQWAIIALHHSTQKRYFSSFRREEILFLENRNKIFSQNDLLSLFPGEEKREIREEYRGRLSFPRSPSISLKGEILLSLENYYYAETPSLFISEMGLNVLRFIPKYNNKIAEYALARDIFNLPPLKKEEILENNCLPPLRVMEKVSPFGNKYITKRELPPNFKYNIYKKCMHYKLPTLLLLIFDFYLGPSSFMFLINEKNNWNNLLGEARKKYFINDLSEILIYREQALFLANALICEEEGEDSHILIWGENEKIFPINAPKEWMSLLVRELKEKANLLPSDMQQPSLFSLENLHL